MLRFVHWGATGIQYAGKQSYTKCSTVLARPVLPVHLRCSTTRTFSKGVQAVAEEAHGMVYSSYACQKYEKPAVERLLSGIKLESGVFTVRTLDTELDNHVTYLTPKNSGTDIEQGRAVPPSLFIFSEGCVVTWGLSENEYVMVLKTLSPAAIEPIAQNLILKETDVAPYTENSSSRVAGSRKGRTQQKIRIFIDASSVMDQFAISHALAVSGAISNCESQLDNAMTRSAFISNSIRQHGKLNMGRSETLKWIGELFALRVALNRANMDLDNFYWDRPTLERLNDNVLKHLEVTDRRKYINESLTYLTELAELLRITQTERSSHNVEVGILLLIVVEVLFECLHLYQGMN